MPDSTDNMDPTPEFAGVSSYAEFCQATTPEPDDVQRALVEAGLVAEESPAPAPDPMPPLQRYHVVMRHSTLGGNLGVNGRGNGGLRKAKTLTVEAADEAGAREVIRKQLGFNRITDFDATLTPVEE